MIRNWTIMGLRDIWTKANNVYEKLDEWIVANTFNQNESLKEIRLAITNFIQNTTDKLPELKFNNWYITIDDEINFIQMDAEKPYLDGMIRDKMAEF